MPADRPVIVTVPGKINLALGVGARRADGYHDLVTLFQAVSLYDRVTAEAAPAGEIGLVMAGVDVAALGPPEDNLAVRAARLLASRRAPGAGVQLTVLKGIPVAGGMGGGSADAAGALLACERLWHLAPDRAGLLGLAAELGSDVPFLTLGGTAVGRGRGEDLSPVPTTGEWSWVLVTSAEGLSTPRVFARFDELTPNPPAPGLPAGLLDALAGGDPYALGPLLRNDLAAAALDLRPDLAATLQAGRDRGAVAGIVSGSGPTCAFLAADAADAGRLAEELRRDGIGRSVHVVSGPARIGFRHEGRG